MNAPDFSRVKRMASVVMLVAAQLFTPNAQAESAEYIACMKDVKSKVEADIQIAIARRIAKNMSPIVTEEQSARYEARHKDSCKIQEDTRKMREEIATAKARIATAEAESAQARARIATAEAESAQALAEIAAKNEQRAAIERLKQIQPELDSLLEQMNGAAHNGQPNTKLKSQIKTLVTEAVPLLSIAKVEDTPYAQAVVMKIANMLGVPAYVASERTDLDFARKHALCANLYSAYLELTRGNNDPEARVKAQKMQTIHQQVTTTLVTASEAKRVLESTKATLSNELNDKPRFLQLIEGQADICNRHISDLTAAQAARIQALSR